MIKMLTEEEFIQDAKQKVIEYETGIRNGSIIACDQIKKLIEYADPEKMDEKFELRPEKIRRVFRFFSYLRIKKDNVYAQFVLEPFQAYFLANVFGIYYKGTNRRRYSESFIFMGRKNGKTNLMAGVALYMFLFDKQVNPNVAILSTVEGRQKVLDDMKKIILQSDEISPYLLWSNYKIYINNSQRVDGERGLKTLKDIGWCKILPNNYAKLDGLEVCAAVFDEIHTFPDWVSYLTVKKGRGANPNSLMMIISTAGYIIDGFCSQYLQYCKRVLSGELEDESIFPMLFCLDKDDYSDGGIDINNRELWYKVNPGLGPIKLLYNMEDDYLKALNNPQARKDFLTKDLNIFLNSKEESTLPPETIETACVPIDEDKTKAEEKIKGLKCWVGIDLALKGDLIAILCLFEDKEKDLFYVKPHFFITAKAKYKYGPKMEQWIKDGDIIECGEEYYDYSIVCKKIEELINTYQVQFVAYDPFKWDSINEKMNWSAISKPKSWFIGVYQGTKTMGKPLTYMLNKLYAGNIICGDNEVMKWSMTNAVIGIGDTNGNPKIFKNKAKDPDEALVAMNDAFVAYFNKRKQDW